MIDFHSHTLPAIDDGSKSVEESLELLRMLKAQGAELVIATPHFLADRESVESFLLRRSAAFGKLSAALANEATDMPSLITGAEVAYYEGISRLENLSSLRIGDSNLLLIEMPVCRWSESSVKELINLSCSGEYRVVLAHIERYMSYQSKDVWRRLLQSGILMQVNAGFFNTFSTRRKALSMLMRGEIHFVGSDCHGVEHRPPRIGRAFEHIEHKLGFEFIKDFTDYQKQLIFG